MTAKKRLILNLFEMNCVSHITHGLWRLPGNTRRTGGSSHRRTTSSSLGRSEASCSVRGWPT